MTRTGWSNGSNELLSSVHESKTVELVSDLEPIDSWMKIDTIPELREGDLQVWRLDLNGPDSRSLLTQAFEALRPEERQRAARMRTGTAPEEFIAGRGLLRHLLSASLNCDPQVVEIVLGTHRKPALRPLRGVRLPQFNVSHSGGMVLIALSRTGSVGVDVEYMDPTVETIDVARAAFHPDDLRRIESAGTAHETLLAFYDCWTRREAVAKADGRGLTLPASGFSTGTPSGMEDVVEIWGNGSSECIDRCASRYFVRSLCVSSQHLGSVALARSCKSPLFLHFSRALLTKSNQHRFDLHDPSSTSASRNQHSSTFVAKEANPLED